MRLTFGELKEGNVYTIYVEVYQYHIKPLKAIVTCKNDVYITLMEQTTFFRSKYTISSNNFNESSYHDFVFLSKDEAYSSIIEKIRTQKKDSITKLSSWELELSSLLGKKRVTFGDLEDGKSYPLYEAVVGGRVRDVMCTFEKHNKNCAITVVNEKGEKVKDVVTNNEIIYMFALESYMIMRSSFSPYYLNKIDVVRQSILYHKNRIRSLNKNLKRNLLYGRETEGISL